jgi:putative transposase
MDTVGTEAASVMTELKEAFQVDEGRVKDYLQEKMRTTIEDMMNEMLDAEADALCQATKYERTAERKTTRSGSYQRKLHTTVGEVNLKMPRLRAFPFETQIIERYRRRQSSVEESLMEMFLAGVSVRRVEDITEALWGVRVKPGVVCDLNQKVYERIEAWRNEPIQGEHAYVYLDGIWLKRSWGGEVKNIAVLVAIGVNALGYREILGVCEGMKEDAESWRGFLRHLKDRGLKGVQLVISDKSCGLVNVLGDFFAEVEWQRCMVHFYRNVFTVTPKSQGKEVVAMLKAIHGQEDLPAALEKSKQVVEKLRAMKLKKAADLVESGIAETLTYMKFPREHWIRIRTNNMLERLLREVRRRTRVVGNFPDSNSALMLVGARLRYVASTKWGSVPYLDMSRLREGKEGEVCDNRMSITRS